MPDREQAKHEQAADGRLSREPVSREESNRDSSLLVINRHLNGLYRYVRHLIAYHQALGDLPPGALDVHDIVDAVVVRAYRELAKQPESRSLRRRLMALANEELRKEIQQLDFRREQTVSKEDDVPETPPEQEAYMLGEEILYFFDRRKI